MTKILSLLLLCFLFVSCNKSSDDKSCNTAVQAEDGSTSTTDCTIDSEPATGEPGTTGTTNGGTTGTTTGGTTGSTSGGTEGGSTGGTTSLPNEAFTFDANLSFYNTSAAQEDKFLKAIEIIKEVIATEEFRTKVLNFTYGGKKTYVDNGGFTNAQIYQKILDGAETLQTSKDNEMDLEVEIYTASTSTVGYTYANSKRIWVNTKFFNTYTAAGVAHNLFHEWLHKLGFKHASSYSTSRDSSVPYAIGNLVGDIGKDFL